MSRSSILAFWVCSWFCFACSDAPDTPLRNTSKHVDKPFSQAYAIKYEIGKDGVDLLSLESDRNGDVQILTSAGLFHCQGGQLLYPGQLVPYRRHRPMTDMQLSAIGLRNQQFIYANETAIFSNAWAAMPYALHQLESPQLIAGGQSATYMVASENRLIRLDTNGIQWQDQLANDSILALLNDPETDDFYVLTSQQILRFSIDDRQLQSIHSGQGFTAFDLDTEKRVLVVGTNNGYFTLKLDEAGTSPSLQQALPVLDLTTVQVVGSSYWFGSNKGAFSVTPKGNIAYYNGQRWLNDDKVIAIRSKMDGTVLVLTETGLSQIHTKEWTLAEKAAFYDRQVRERHIRYGFNASLAGLQDGNPSTGYLVDSDNDGLWTAMYLGGEAFRYAVTGDPAALANCDESLTAMERLYHINPVPGFPSRSFERHGYLEQLANPDRWHQAEDPKWDWKGTTSSDEAIGHMFVFGVLADLAPTPDIRDRAILMMDTLMAHVIRHDLYLIDYDGKPTTWGRWNPTYVNARPEMVGDRKLNSSNLIAMLQTAYHFTKKEKYKDKAFQLMEEHGYLDNLTYPMNQVGPAPADADDWSKMLSEEWNHSDDEMYFLGYWGLYRYAFNDSLQSLYKKAILEHWEIERPEKEGLWNIFTALVGADSIDLEEAIWYLQEYPLDLIDWSTENSHRKDIELIAANFRGQNTKIVLPPSETKVARHNANRFRLDSKGEGRTEYSAGDIWLLPYWMGRYLEVISAPIQ